MIVGRGRGIVFLWGLLFLNNAVLFQDDAKVAFIKELRRAFQSMLDEPNIPTKKGLPRQKQIIRNTTIKKLQYPRFPNSRIIVVEDEFEEKYYVIKGETQQSKSPHPRNIILQSYISNIIYKYSNSLAFTFPDLKKYIKSIEESGGDIKSPETLARYYMETVKNIVSELLKKYSNFWLFIKSFFVDNSKMFKYLSKNLCPDDIYLPTDEENGTAIFSNKFSEHYIQNIVNLDTRLPKYFHILNTYKNSAGDTFFYISGNLKVKKYDDDFFKKEFAKIPKSSICYNLGVLHLYSEFNLNIPYYISTVYECINRYFDGDKIYRKICKTLPDHLLKLYRGLKIYFYYQNRILKKKILPEIYDMCYNKCLCTDYNISCKEGKEIGIDEDNVINLITKLFKNESEIFLIKLTNFISGINTINYNKEVEKKCHSIQNLKQVLETINFSNDFLSNYKKVYSEWSNIRKSDKKEYNKLSNILPNLIGSIDKLKQDFYKLGLRNKFIQVFENEKDIICRFIIFTEIFSKIGYDNVLDIGYSDLARYIGSRDERERFLGFVIFKTISSANTIKYNNKEVRFFNFSFDFPRVFSDINSSLNTLSEWLYGSRAPSLFCYFGGLLTFFDYYLFFIDRVATIEKYNGKLTSDFPGCLLNKRNFLACITLGLEEKHKPYFRIIKRFFTQRKANNISVKNLLSILHRLDRKKPIYKLYEVSKETMECCKGNSVMGLVCGNDDAICSVQYQSLSYIRRKGKRRLTEILGEKLFKFLQKEVKK